MLDDPTPVLVAAVAAAALALGPTRPLEGQTQGGQRPTFRAAVNFVQVDVYPTANGRAVADLSKDEFEVLEDGLPQSVTTFEHVSVRPDVDGSPRVDPRSVAEANELAADPHNRLFVVFLDSYHVTDPAARHDERMWLPGGGKDRRRTERKALGPARIDKAIVSFLERAIGPNDLVAPMSPEMDARHMVFSRRPERFADWVASAWARRFSWDELDPEEERWAFWYPPDEPRDPFGCYRGIFEEMVLRRREGLTLQALDDTVSRLGELRDGRKAVLVVSEGWQLFRPNSALARPLPRVSSMGCPVEPPPPTPGIYVGQGGKPQFGSDPRKAEGSDLHDCDAARVRLAQTDDDRDFRRLLDRANRETVSFYPIDPRGLAVFDTPEDARAPGSTSTPGAGDDIAAVRTRLRALQNLASDTDGFMSESNDLNASLKRVADDLSDYYLLGYNSTNGRLDGAFRRITVRVKRPGVQVRARRGYVAATQADSAANAASEAPVDPAVRLRERVLATLETLSRARAVTLASGVDWRTGSAPRLWAIAELAASAANAEWHDGGDVQLAVRTANGAAVASAHGTLSPSSRVFAWQSDAALEAGDYLVRVTARPSSGGDAAAEQLRVVLPSPQSPQGVLVGSPHVLRRGPTTGLAFVPTADARFRRIERVRVMVSIAGDPGELAGRLLDRRGQAIGIPVAASMHDDNGARVATAEANLAPLAPGDYLLEITFGAASSRQTILTAIRIVP